MTNLEKHKFIVNVSVIVQKRMFLMDPLVLVMKRSMKEDKNAGKYGIAGGKMDDTDLNLEDAAKREVFEEVGLDVHIHKMFENHIAKTDDGQKLYVVFEGSMKDLDQEIKIDENEVESVRWLDFEDLMQMNDEDFTRGTRKLLLEYLYGIK